MSAVTPAEYKRQCVLAARSSRLDPKALHPGERLLLGPSLSDADRTAYLHVRNGILRLWTRNPAVFVSRDEALEATKDKAALPAVPLAHEWLARHGYINFGCISIIDEPYQQPMHLTKRRTIVVVGGGVAGLACARQLDNFIQQFPDRWWKKKRELLPRIVVLEGRKRIGGRIYSHPLKTQVTGSLPYPVANMAETGAHIITGFAHGNPLDAVIRGQLALPHHMLTDDLILHDYDGRLIDVKDDDEMADVYDQIITAASQFGWKPVDKNENLNSMVSDVLPTVSSLDDKSRLSPAHIDTLNTAAFAHNGTVKPIDPHPSLGAFVDELANRQRQDKGLTAQKMRLLNWHIAHLEYGNACNLRHLSLGGWDQDRGNEFGGRHAQMIGGYSQLPRALWQQPAPLDVEFERAATHIQYATPSSPGKAKAMVRCADGSVYQADHIVCTVPLGVLHDDAMSFEPPLPQWKLDVWDRMGFGVLNKVILSFDHVFWEYHRDMFGCLNQTKVADSMHQQDYAANRGKSFLFWNCVKTTGQPVLVALMAGDAAEAQEHVADAELVADVTTKLARIFRLPHVPQPTEAIVTRWRRDPFARGSYSYLGPTAQPGDYELMAAPVGNLHFAGEATCGTHPATVHGAFLSGLRAAAEVLDAMIGPMSAK